MKKIFFIADAKSIHTKKWIDYFVDTGYDAYLATFSNENLTKCKNVYFLSEKKINSDGKNFHYLMSVFKLAKILYEIKPEIINAHFSYSLGLVALIAKKISKIDTKFSVVCHGSDILANYLPFVFNLINKFVLKHCDKIFAVSDEIKDKIYTFGIHRDKVFVGQYGLDISCKKCNKDIDMLSNRAYCKNSRIEFLLDGLLHFKDNNLNIVFVLPKISDEKLVYFKSNYPFIKFYKDLPHNEIINILSRTKIYISATKSDGTSLSLLEALNFDVIPIVSNIVSNRSWILNGINGFLFDTKEQFLDSVKIALKDNDIDTKMNKKLIKQRCDYDIQMKKIENFLLG